MRTYISMVITFSMLVGCGSSSSTDDEAMTMAADTAADTSAPGESQPVADEVESICQASAPGELCVTIKIPEDLPGPPEKVSVHFFNTLPPTGPPTILGAEVAERSELEKYQPGATLPVNFAGLPASGELYLYGVLYMPGGGAQTWQTTPNVDYHGAYSWDTPVTFTGEPVNLEETIEFAIYQEPTP